MRIRASFIVTNLEIKASGMTPEQVEENACKAIASNVARNLAQAAPVVKSETEDKKSLFFETDFYLLTPDQFHSIKMALRGILTNSTGIKDHKAIEVTAQMALSKLSE